MTNAGVAYIDLTDDDLLGRLRNDDHSAFTEIFNRYNNLLYAHAFNKLRNESDSRDVVQDTFLKMWNRRRLMEENNNLLGYLFVSVMNSIFNLMRHNRTVSNYADFYEPNEDSGIYADTMIREKQFAQMIEREISGLPPRMREVFELRRRHYLSNREVAVRLGITESTASDQMKKALRHLRGRLGLGVLFLLLIN